MYRAAARSDLRELASPEGFGLFARFSPTSLLSFRASFYKQAESSVRLGRICTQYVPAVGCGEEEVRTSTRMKGFIVSGALRGRPLSHLEVEGGGGFSLNRVRGEEETASGRRSSLFIHESLQLGALLQASVRVRPLRRLPFIVETGLSQHLLRLSACAEDDWEYDPYCGTTGLRGGWVGVGLQLATPGGGP